MVEEPAEFAQWRVQVAHRGITAWYFFIGSVMLFSPPYFFGPTWSYFRYLPHGGSGLGYACYLLGVLMLVSIRRKSKRLMSITLGMGGVAFWLAAALIAAQGIIGRTGLMEAPLMLYISIDSFFYSVRGMWKT